MKFQKGNIPWNKGKKVQKKYNQGSDNPAWNGGKSKRKGYTIIKTSKGYVMEHHLVWLQANQSDKIPRGFVIHHKDGSRYNNNLSNLKLMSNGEHTRLHNNLNPKKYWGINEPLRGV